jgi:phage-related protein
VRREGAADWIMVCCYSDALWSAKGGKDCDYIRSERGSYRRAYVYYLSRATFLLSCHKHKHSGAAPARIIIKRVRRPDDVSCKLVTYIVLTS